MADNVLIDLNGKSISMSHEFSLRQRYFSAIELSSKPFKAKTGPDVLGYLHDQITPAHGVTIYNGVLGRTSHMGIHGTDNNGLWLDSVVIRDFEVAGIQLNGASNVHLSNVHVGPSLGAPESSGRLPATATFSIAQFMSNTIQNTGIEWMHEFADLKSSIDSFVADKVQGRLFDRHSIFEDPAESSNGLPDGGALYGIHFHTTGPSSHDFAACADAQQQDYSIPHRKFQLTNVVIQDLHLKADEVVRMMWRKKSYGNEPLPPVALTGILGETFQGVGAAHHDGTYRGNRLVEAQLALQKLKNANTQATWVNYGNVSLPNEVLSWTRGMGTLEDLERAGLSYDCERDAMGHSNKGAVGLRLDGVDDVRLLNVAIANLKNVGTRGPGVTAPRSVGNRWCLW